MAGVFVLADLVGKVEENPYCNNVYEATTPFHISGCPTLISVLTPPINSQLVLLTAWMVVLI